MERPNLSICIATYRRAAFIGETLEAILRQLPERVEVVIVDGASPDNTPEIIQPLARRNTAVRYIREASNSGFDADYDKAVGYAHGEYCWLMSDDDILVPGAIARVCALLGGSLDLLVVNAQIRSADLSTELSPRIMEMTEDRLYDEKSRDRFLADAGGYLSYIGAVVIRRSLWLDRERSRYFGSMFVHVGVIFQAPIASVMVLAEPLILIRLGNAMWSKRGFEIWMFKWPELIWSFEAFSDSSKKSVVAREPWKQWRQLTLYRAMGVYSSAGYRQFFKAWGRGGLLQFITAVMPAVAANALTTLYWSLTNRKKARAGIYELARSGNSNSITRLIAHRLGIPTR